MSVLQQMMFGVSGSNPPTLEFLASVLETANGTSHTYSGVSFGTATADRLLVFCVTGFRSATVNITSATIGGVTATVNMSYPNSVTQVYIFSATVPTGTSGDIVFTTSSTSNTCLGTLYSIKGLQSTTPTITLTDIQTSSDPSITISPDINTVIIAHAISYTGAGTMTWSGTAGLTEYSDHANENIYQSSAAKVFTTAGSSLTIIATPTVGTTERRMQVIGFK